MDSTIRATGNASPLSRRKATTPTGNPAPPSPWPARRAAAFSFLPREGVACPVILGLSPCLCLSIVMAEVACLLGP
ncbi:hypothetical protein Ct61P_12427 [Colletotrichum tofieldiae]|nr:hypothetical protein Ct61P_12427 [Colletotrichum tofieldiae]